MCFFVLPAASLSWQAPESMDLGPAPQQQQQQQRRPGLGLEEFEVAVLGRSAGKSASKHTAKKPRIAPFGYSKH